MTARCQRVGEVSDALHRTLSTFEWEGKALSNSLKRVKSNDRTIVRNMPSCATVALDNCMGTRLILAWTSRGFRCRHLEG